VRIATPAMPESRIWHIANVRKNPYLVLDLLSLLERCMEKSKHVSPCNAPAVIYYIDAENPYAAKFGTDVNEWGKEAWVKQIKTSSAFTGVRCITDLVKHMVIKTKKCYKNTSYQNTYHSYHDALLQLTHDTTVEWMMKTKIPDENTVVYKRWIKPENGLNDSFGPRWKQRPIGNSPELMPLDNSLNQDVHGSVRKHAVMSLRLCTEWRNDSLFSMATPKEASHAYRRIFDPTTGVAPKPERIVQDVKKVMNALQVIFDAEGVYVPGLAGGRTPGGRHTATTEGKKPRGGTRVRMEFQYALVECELHAHLRTALAEHGGNITSRFAIRDERESEDEDEVMEWCNFSQSN
jgi:hypothetical protein